MLDVKESSHSLGPLQEKQLRQQKKAKLAARTKLSFAQDDEGDEDAEENGAAKVWGRHLHWNFFMQQPWLHLVCKVVERFLKGLI